MFRPYMWAIFRLRFNLQISYTSCVGRFVWGLGGWVDGGEKGRDLVVSIMGTVTPGYIYVFCIYLRTNSDLCHLQHKLIGFYIGVYSAVRSGSLNKAVCVSY